MSSGVATFGGHRVGTFCEVDHSLHNRISVFCTFISDLVLLVFMFIGVLRWKGARNGNGLWRLLYTQVSLPQRYGRFDPIL